MGDLDPANSAKGVRPIASRLRTNCGLSDRDGRHQTSARQQKARAAGYRTEKSLGDEAVHPRERGTKQSISVLEQILGMGIVPDFKLACIGGWLLPYLDSDLQLHGAGPSFLRPYHPRLYLAAIICYIATSVGGRLDPWGEGSQQPKI